MNGYIPPHYFPYPAPNFWIREDYTRQLTVDCSSLSMPWFGAQKDRSAFIATLDQPADASLHVVANTNRWGQTHRSVFALSPFRDHLGEESRRVTARWAWSVCRSSYLAPGLRGLFLSSRLWPLQGRPLPPGDAADRLALRKAYALVLLKWRGHPLPELAELSS